MFKSLLSRLFAHLLPRVEDRSQLEMEYLRGSASRYDLEMREREIDRGKFALV